MNEELLKSLLEAVNEYITEYREMPYHFLLERDVQCGLFSRLRNEINRSLTVEGINRENYELNLINAEYLDNIDVECLDPETIGSLKIDDLKQENGNDWYIYHLPILLGIEIKYIWMGQDRPSSFFTSDANKFKNSKFKKKTANWLSICFIQDEKTEERHLRKLSRSHSYEVVPYIDKLNELYVVGPVNTCLVNIQ
jgi:hypothetical protein